jgi:hypothetical protein
MADFGFYRQGACSSNMLELQDNGIKAPVGKWIRAQKASLDIYL